MVENTNEDDIGGTSVITFFATDIAEHWFLPSAIETEEIVKAPSVETWLFKNPEALAAVRRGLSDATKGRVSKVDLDNL